MCAPLRPLVLLHGFAATPRCFGRLLSRLPGVRWLAPTVRGHDRSDAPLAPSRFEDEVSRIAGLVRAEFTERVQVMGYSQGGRLALGLLLRHPDLVHAATLIGTHPGLQDDGARARRRRADEGWCELLLEHGIEAFVDAWEKQPLFLSQRSLDPELRQQQRRERLSLRPEGLVWALRNLGLGVMPSYWERLREIQVPVHLMAGRDDEKFVRLGRRAAEALGCKLALVDGAGHNIVLERPEAVASALLESRRS